MDLDDSTLLKITPSLNQTKLNSLKYFQVNKTNSQITVHFGNENFFPINLYIWFIFLNLTFSHKAIVVGSTAVAILWIV